MQLKDATRCNARNMALSLIEIWDADYGILRNFLVRFEEEKTRDVEFGQCFDVFNFFFLKKSCWAEIVALFPRPADSR